MVKIFYDEDDIDDNKLIDNYFFFEYYLKVIEFDVLNNKDLMQEIADGYKQQYTTEWLLMKRQCRPKVQQLLNQIEFSKFKVVYNDFLSRFNGFLGYIEDIDVIVSIKNYTIEGLINKYKNYLNHKFGKINEYKIYKTLNSINIDLKKL